MKVFLVSNYDTVLYKELINDIGVEVVNNSVVSLPEAYNTINATSQKFDTVIITDESIHMELHLISGYINKIIESDYFNSLNANIKLFTKSFVRYQKLQKIYENNNNLEIVFYDYIFIDYETLKASINDKHKKSKVLPEKKNLIKKEKPKEISKEKVKENNNNPISQKEEKVPLIKRMFAKKEKAVTFEAEDEVEKTLKTISGGFSRVIAITGHRGSGITSTVANLAYAANERQISTVIVDLDVNFRNLNLYFPEFGDNASEVDELKASLVRCLAKPESYKINGFSITDKLHFIGLPFDFEDNELIDRFYDSERVIGLISLLKQRFNLVLLDIPFEYFLKLSNIGIHIDSFGICINNNLHSVVTTIRCADIYLKKEQISYLNSKAKIIVTKYNPHSSYDNERFTPEKVQELMSSDLTDLFDNEFMLAGAVREYDEFDKQIENETVLALSEHEFKQVYSKILVGIL